MRHVQTQPKDGEIKREEFGRVRRISLWALEKAKEREAKVKDTKTYRTWINGKLTEVTFSEPNAFEKLEAFCLDKGMDVSIFV